MDLPSCSVIQHCDITHRWGLQYVKSYYKIPRRVFIIHQAALSRLFPRVLGAGRGEAGAAAGPRHGPGHGQLPLGPGEELRPHQRLIKVMRLKM
jgi:hypothetical protein